MLYSHPPVVELEVAGINNTCVFSANVAGFTWSVRNFKKSSKVNENSSMRAIAKFCEHEQASTRLNFASKSSKGKILRAVEKLYDHSIPLLLALALLGCFRNVSSCFYSQAQPILKRKIPSNNKPSKNKLS